MTRLHACSFLYGAMLFANACPKCDPMVHLAYDVSPKLPQDKRKPRTPTKFTVDSGATIHCITDISLFTSIDRSVHVKIRVANNKLAYGSGLGTVALPLTNRKGITETIVLHNCVYCPQFSGNLISVRRLWKDNRISSHFGETSYLRDKYTNSTVSMISLIHTP